MHYINYQVTGVRLITGVNKLVTRKTANVVHLKKEMMVELCKYLELSDI